MPKMLLNSNILDSGQLLNSVKYITEIGDNCNMRSRLRTQRVIIAHLGSDYYRMPSFIPCMFC